MGLIRSTLITYVFDVPEADIRQALIYEAAEKHGLTHDGKIIKGVTGKVSFNGRALDAPLKRAMAAGTPHHHSS